MNQTGMEYLPNNSKDLLPGALLQQFESDLSNRMGDSNWVKRKTIEDRINPTSGLSFLRLFKIWSHKVFKLLLWLALGIAGIRKTARENCWKTFLSNHSVKLTGYKGNTSLKILHLSDFHLDTCLEQSEHWAAIIQPLDYDFTVITGDFFNGYALPGKERIEALKRVVDSIHTPIFGIFGNHDCALSAPYIESLGIKLLLNESTEFNIHGDSILITGIDDPHFFKSDDLDYATRSFSETERFALKILLTHAPKDPEKYANAGFDLCLCGHTHGGQLCTVSSVPLLRNGRYATDTISGWWQKCEMKGFTSRGTGTGRLSFCMHCPPEIALLEIIPNQIQESNSPIGI